MSERTFKQALLESGAFDQVSQPLASGSSERFRDSFVSDVQRRMFHHIAPAYLLDTNFQYLDWNPAFEEVVARPLGIRKGMHGTALVTRLANCDEVMERSMKVFAPGEHPVIDVETLLLQTEKYGLIRFQKLASQILDSRGQKIAWAITLHIVSADRLELLWSDLLSRIEHETLWHQYASSRDQLLSVIPGGMKALDRLVELARSAGHCLELGTATGELTRKLLSSGGPAKVWGQEDNAGLIDFFSAKLGTGQNRFVAVRDGVDQLKDYPQSFFDVAVSWDGIWRRQPADFTHIAQILKRGGQFGLFLRTSAAKPESFAVPSSSQSSTEALDLAQVNLARALSGLDKSSVRPSSQEVGRSLESSGFKLTAWEPSLLNGAFVLAIATKE